jgi:2Fe-2S ferredoxin
MIKITVIDRAGDEKHFEGQEMDSLMHILRQNEEILAMCGGSCSCATCHVILDPEYMAKLRPMSDDEDALLDGSANRTETSRLSCQIPFDATLSGLKLTIPPEE